MQRRGTTPSSGDMSGFDMEGGSAPSTPLPATPLPPPTYDPQVVSGLGGGPPSSGGSGASRRDGNLYFIAGHTTDMLKQYAAVALGIGFICAALLPVIFGVICLVFSACACGFLFSIYLCNDVLSCDDGSKEMREVSDPIREGAEGFLKVQYTAVSRLAIPLSFFIFLSYLFRPSSAMSAHVSNFSSGIVAAVSFLAGCVCR